MPPRRHRFDACADAAADAAFAIFTLPLLMPPLISPAAVFAISICCQRQIFAAFAMRYFRQMSASAISMPRHFSLSLRFSRASRRRRFATLITLRYATLSPQFFIIFAIFAVSTRCSQRHAAMPAITPARRHFDAADAIIYAT
jgi:hypothetical protein